MNRILKLNSRQGGTFSRTQNLVDWDVPSGIVWNMKKSYININCSIQTSDTAGEIHNLQMIRNGMGNAFNHALCPSVAMIKNASLGFENIGMVEDLRDVNVLKCNTRNYEKDVEELHSESYKGVNSAKDESNLFGSAFQDFIKDSNLPSRNKDHDIRVPLSEIFGLGEQEQVDLGKYGQGTLHLELDLTTGTNDAFVVHERQGGDADGGVGYWALIDTRSSDTADKSANGSIGTRNDNQTGDLTLAQCGTDAIPATFPASRLYDSLEQSPFWVGESLKFTGTGIADQSLTVASLAYDPSTRLVTLTMSEKIVLTDPATTATAVKVIGNNTAGASIVFNSCQLVIYEDTSGSKPPSGIQYKTYTTEVDTENAIANFSRNYYLEPECSNVLIMTPLPASDILSDLDVTSYRFRVNGENTTNRAIPARSPLHYDRIARVLLNQDKQLKNTHECSIDIDSGRGTLIGSHRASMMAETVPITANQKQLEVEIHSGTGLSKIYLFKEVQRQI